MVDPPVTEMYNENIILSLMWFICEDNPTVISLNNGQIITTLLDHCLKSLHNTVKHMNLPTVVKKKYTTCVKLYTSCVICLHNCW